MLTYDDYVKNWPSDYSKAKLFTLYYEYYVTEMKINTLKFAVQPAVCAFEECKAFPAPTCEAPKKSRFGAKVCNQEKEVENTMTTYNETEASRKYLNQRVESIRYNKRDDLRKMFNMDKSSVPVTYKQLIDAIKNDKYTLDTKRTAAIDANVDDEDDDYGYYGNAFGNAFDGIIFKLDNAPDMKGFEEASKQLEKKLQETKDIVFVGTPAEGLKALQELEAWTPAGKSN